MDDTSNRSTDMDTGSEESEDIDLPSIRKARMGSGKVVGMGVVGTILLVAVGSFILFVALPTRILNDRTATSTVVLEEINSKLKPIGTILGLSMYDKTSHEFDAFSTTTTQMADDFSFENNSAVLTTKSPTTLTPNISTPDEDIDPPKSDVKQAKERDEKKTNTVSPKMTISPFSTTSPVIANRPSSFIVLSTPQQLVNLPNHPVVTAEKVSGKYIYNFYSESVSYETGVTFCRRFGKGSHLLSIESYDERKTIDAYISGYQTEMFNKREARFLWTGGYFDLESDHPYDLHWLDNPTAIKETTYYNFCPESVNTREMIDLALSKLKSRSQGLLALKPYDRRWAHVIVDYRNNRISQSCWQIIERDILSPEEWKLPFVCKQ